MLLRPSPTIYAKLKPIFEYTSHQKVVLLQSFTPYLSLHHFWVCLTKFWSKHHIWCYSIQKSKMSLSLVYGWRNYLHQKWVLVYSWRWSYNRSIFTIFSQACIGSRLHKLFLDIYYLIIKYFKAAQPKRLNRPPNYWVV